MQEAEGDDLKAANPTASVWRPTARRAVLLVKSCPLVKHFCQSAN